MEDVEAHGGRRTGLRSTQARAAAQARSCSSESRRGGQHASVGGEKGCEGAGSGAGLLPVCNSVAVGGQRARTRVSSCVNVGGRRRGRAVVGCQGEVVRAESRRYALAYMGASLPGVADQFHHRSSHLSARRHPGPHMRRDRGQA